MLFIFYTVINSYFNTGKCGETGSAAIQIRPSAELIKLATVVYVLLLAVNIVNSVKNRR